jgi:HSP20 family protein
MSTKTLSRNLQTPMLFDDFFKPWNTWFENGGNLWNRLQTIPAVNITENKDHYLVELAAPGMKKEDFNIRIDGNLLTISSEKEESKEEKEEKYTRQEYSYTAFNRSFTLPDGVSQEKIEATYENGVLRLSLPLKEELRQTATQKIMVK